MITTPARAIVLGGWAAEGFDCISGVVGGLVFFFFPWAKGWELPQTAKFPYPTTLVCCQLRSQLLDSLQNTSIISIEVLSDS